MKMGSAVLLKESTDKRFRKGAELGTSYRIVKILEPASDRAKIWLAKESSRVPKDGGKGVVHGPIACQFLAMQDAKIDIRITDGSKVKLEVHTPQNYIHDVEKERTYVVGSIRNLNKVDEEIMLFRETELRPDGSKQEGIAMFGPMKRWHLVYFYLGRKWAILQKRLLLFSESAHFFSEKFLLALLVVGLLASCCGMLCM